MSKKRKKNSNYHYAAPVKTVAAPALKTGHIVSIIAAALVLIGVIVGIVACSVSDKKQYVEMEFKGYGSIVIELCPDEAPITVKNFVDLVEDGFYDGLTIFRAQENFVIQGGKDDSVDLPTIKGEFTANGVKNNISHKRGVISMARTTVYDSATSQFFITLHDGAKGSLDGLYAGFGYVVEGMDVVDAIAEDLFDHAIDTMGFVADKDAITITSAKVIDYKK